MFLETRNVIGCEVEENLLAYIQGSFNNNLTYIDVVVNLMMSGAELDHKLFTWHFSAQENLLDGWQHH